MESREKKSRDRKKQENQNLRIRSIFTFIAGSLAILAIIISLLQYRTLNQTFEEFKAKFDNIDAVKEEGKAIIESNLTPSFIEEIQKKLNDFIAEVQVKISNLENISSKFIDKNEDSGGVISKLKEMLSSKDFNEPLNNFKTNLLLLNDLKVLINKEKGAGKDLDKVLYFVFDYLDYLQNNAIDFEKKIEGILENLSLGKNDELSLEGEKKTLLETLKSSASFNAPIEQITQELDKVKNSLEVLRENFAELKSSQENGKQKEDFSRVNESFIKELIEKAKITLTEEISTKLTEEISTKQKSNDDDIYVAEVVETKAPDPFYNSEIKRLEDEISKLNSLTKPDASQDLLKVVNEIKKDLESIKQQIKNLNSDPVLYDLKKINFAYLNAISKLEIDPISAPITAETMNLVFEKQLKALPITEKWKNYEFGARVIDTELTLKEWIIGPTSIFDMKGKDGKSLSGYPKYNTFDPKEPKQLTNEYPRKFSGSIRISLGTGTGKSTLFARCLAHHVGGVTLVVPYSSLIGSVIDAHEKWLSCGKDTDPSKRVTVCPICQERHTAQLDDKGNIVTGTKYITVHNGPVGENGINVYTWWEFLDAYENRPEEIKKWVVFDEAHTDLPAYRLMIEKFRKMGSKPNEKNLSSGRLFEGMVEMSATFSDLPTSKKLSGKISDYCVKDFRAFLDAGCPDFFKKKVIVFCDDLKKIELKHLDKANIKYIILNDNVKEYATAIVRSMSAPALVFADRSYSVGFSFGDVNVISTGVSQRRIVGLAKDNKTLESSIIEGVSDFADLLQERGRAARDPDYIGAAWVSLIQKPVGYSGDKLSNDEFYKKLGEYFNAGKTPAEVEKKNKIINDVVKEASKKPETVPLSEKVAKQTINRLLLSDLTEKISITSLFSVKPSEKGKREPGQYIFTSKLMKYLDFNEGGHLENKDTALQNIILDATAKKIDEIYKTSGYTWRETSEEEDDFVCETEVDAKLIGFYLYARESYKASLVKDKLTITFKKFDFSGEKKKSTQVSA